VGERRDNIGVTRKVRLGSGTVFHLFVQLDQEEKAGNQMGDRRENRGFQRQSQLQAGRISAARGEVEGGRGKTENQKGGSEKS